MVAATRIGTSFRSSPGSLPNPNGFLLTADHQRGIFVCSSPQQLSLGCRRETYRPPAESRGFVRMGCNPSADGLEAAISPLPGTWAATDASVTHCKSFGHPPE